MGIMELENKGALQCSDTIWKPAFSQVNADRFLSWLISDRAIDARFAVNCSCAVFKTFLFEFPNSNICPSIAEMEKIFLSAVVKVPAGTCLPLKDFEKLALNGSLEPIIEINHPSLSLDLVSELVLEVFLKAVRKWEETFTRLWVDYQEKWDW